MAPVNVKEGKKRYIQYARTKVRGQGQEKSKPATDESTELDLPFAAFAAGCREGCESDPDPSLVLEVSRH
jgi:hypothetical protein